MNDERVNITTVTNNLLRQMPIVSLRQAVKFIAIKIGVSENKYTSIQQAIKKKVALKEYYLENGKYLCRIKPTDTEIGEYQGYIKSVWLFIKYMENEPKEKCSFVTMASPRTISFVLEDSVIEIVYFSRGNEVYALNALINGKGQADPNFIKRIAIMEDEKRVKLLKGGGFAYICKVDSDSGDIEIIKKISKEDRWKV